MPVPIRYKMARIISLRPRANTDTIHSEVYESHARGGFNDYSRHSAVVREIQNKKGYTMRATMLFLVLLACCGSGWGAVVLRVDAVAPPGGDGFSWETALTSIQAAIDAAGAAGGGEVWVAAGSYTDVANPETGAMLTLLPGVSLYGGFAGTETARSQAAPEQHETRLDARTALDGGQAQAVLVGAEGSTVDGFTVRDFSVNGFSFPVVTSIYAFVLRAGMTLSRCVFEDNTAPAISVQAADDVTLKRLLFERNDANRSLIDISRSPRLLIEDSAFIENKKYTGLISTYRSSDVQIRRTLFLRNVAIVSYFWSVAYEDLDDRCPPTYTNCWFEQNWKVFVSETFGPRVFNSVFKGNTNLILDFPNQVFEKSSVIADGWQEEEGERWIECEGEPCPMPTCPAQYCPTLFSHCTFLDIGADMQRFYMAGNTLTLVNSIFPRDVGDGYLWWWYCDPPDVRHTLLQAPYPSGVGNLVGDPGFAGPGNPRLGPGSVAIGAGLDASAPEFGSITTDILGRPRGVHGAGYDLGAYQSGHAADTDADGSLSLSELLRIIQFYNAPQMHCDLTAEDGYAPGPGLDYCAPHSADYAPQDWAFNLSELLRVIQLYNASTYHPCQSGEDGFCPGAG